MSTSQLGFFGIFSTTCTQQTYDIDGRGPQVVEVEGGVCEALRVHRHQVHDLPHRVLGSARVGQQQGLQDHVVT